MSLHFTERARERFGIETTRDDVAELIAKIETGAARQAGHWEARTGMICAPFIVRSDRHRIDLPVVFDAVGRRLVTCLPRDAAILRRDNPMRYQARYHAAINKLPAAYRRAFADFLVRRGVPA